MNLITFRCGRCGCTDLAMEGMAEWTLWTSLHCDLNAQADSIKGTPFGEEKRGLSLDIFCRACGRVPTILYRLAAAERDGALSREDLRRHVRRCARLEDGNLSVEWAAVAAGLTNEGAEV